MPPEVMGVDSEGSVTGGAKYGTSADVYSLGMVIFEMVSANDPFAGLSTMQAAFAGMHPPSPTHTCTHVRAQTRTHTHIHIHALGGMWKEIQKVLVTALCSCGETDLPQPYTQTHTYIFIHT
jgi:serine/threonine protein kinase